MTTAPRYQGLFEDWEIGVAKNVIERFRKQWKCLELEGFDDLLQECLTHWHFSKDDYDPSAGANERTFMSRVVEHKIQHIIEKLTTDKRKVSSESVSLDERISDEEDSPTFLDRLSEDENLTSNLHVSAELKIDITRAIQKLTPKQQELCRLLGEEGMSMSEASEALKTPRGTLYEDVKRIKAIFEKAKLHDYLD
ncbi:MAG: sigma-70 family RNA polymerase sigma factor [Candidatus Margulisiibacteriota bacterium]